MDPKLSIATVEDVDAENHELTVGNLKPGRAYFFQVRQKFPNFSQFLKG